MPMTWVRPLYWTNNGPSGVTNSANIIDAGTPPTATQGYSISPAAAYNITEHYAYYCPDLPAGTIKATLKVSAAVMRWGGSGWGWHEVAYSLNGGGSYTVLEYMGSAYAEGQFYEFSVALSLAQAMASLLWKFRPTTGSTSANTMYGGVRDCWVECWTVIAAPASPSCTAGFLKNNLSWSAVTGATSYKIYWTDNGTDPTKSSSVISPGLVTAYEHGSLTPGTTYKYRIAAVDGGDPAGGTLSSQVSGVPTGLVRPFSVIIIA